MTNLSIGSGSGIYSAQALALDAEGRLALLLLETQEAQQAFDRDDTALARERFVAAADAQVEAMHEEAECIRLGAYFQAGASVTAAGIQIGDVASPSPCDALGRAIEEPWGEIGAGVSQGVSQPLGSLLGAAPAADARADAQRAATSARQAEWQLSDADEAIERSDERQRQVTSWLSSQASARADARAAIIAGLA